MRLRELQRLYDRLKDEDETEAARLLKQAAKEVGEKFTNVERKEHTGADSEPLKFQWVDPDSVDAQD